MRNFKVGDIVRVKNWSKNYDTNVSWFISHLEGIQPEWMIRYAFGTRRSSAYPTIDSDDSRYKILFIDEDVALITQDAQGRCVNGALPVYLIGVEGLRFASECIISMDVALKKLEEIYGTSVEIKVD